jgi:hypothetical protein
MYRLLLRKTHSAHMPEFRLDLHNELVACGSIDACLDATIPVYVKDYEHSTRGVAHSPFDISQIVSSIIYYHLDENTDWEDLCHVGWIEEPNAYAQLRQLLQAKPLPRFASL